MISSIAEPWVLQIVRVTGAPRDAAGSPIAPVKKMLARLATGRCCGSVSQRTGIGVEGLSHERDAEIGRRIAGFLPHRVLDGLESFESRRRRNHQPRMRVCMCRVERGQASQA